MEPVNPKKSGAIDYFKTIFHAIDLRTIEERLRTKNYYYNVLSLNVDIYQIIKNCIFYNGKFHFITEKCNFIENIICKNF